MLAPHTATHWTDQKTPPTTEPTFHDEGYGYDLFGLHPPMVERALRAAMPWYRRYFRVTSRGIENVPANGGAILVANHAGMLPIDAAMLWVDVVSRTGRILRTISDRFVPMVPFASAFFARTGVVSGTHANVRQLLDRGEAIAIFPEGVTGPAKPFRDRYKLQDWRVGHAELAIRHQVPIIPVSIIGAEECWPLLLRLRSRLFGAPYLPIPMTPFPLPSRFAITYGSPIDPRYPARLADDPSCIEKLAGITRAAVEDLVERGLVDRRRS